MVDIQLGSEGLNKQTTDFMMRNGEEFFYLQWKRYQTPFKIIMVINETVWCFWTQVLQYFISTKLNQVIDTRSMIAVQYYAKLAYFHGIY